VELTREIAEPIYVALIMDTGHFQYTNTTPEAHDLAADLLRAGVDPRRVLQQLYERVALAHLKLMGRAAERAAVYEGGRLIISYLVRSDFEDFGVGEEYAEGIIERLREIDGTEMAAMIREPPEPPGSPRRVSLRASHDELDVSAIARKRAGGGHRQAAGFSTEESIDEIVQFLRQEFVEATSAPAGA
jgi:phosphoesterase RecJ-like protein